MTKWPALAALLLVVTVAGCRTHEERFEKGTVPRDPDVSALTSAANPLIVGPQQQLASLSPEALVALTEAAAAQFGATGAPGMRDLTRRYARYLLRAQLPSGDGIGFYSAASPTEVDPELSLRAGLALLDAHRATQDPALRGIIDRLIVTVTSAPFGWLPYRGGMAVRATRVDGRPVNVAWTALAAALLSRAAAELGVPRQRDADAALRTVEGAQAAVGRWYALVPSRSAMSLWQWAQTLSGLQHLGGPTADGILGAGVPALHAAAFAGGGRPATNELTADRPRALAQSYVVLGRYPDRSLGSSAFVRLLGRLREDGTVRNAPAGDVETQAVYATALAREAVNVKGVIR